MSNEKFKVKFGLAVGDSAATIDTTGNIVTTGNLTVPALKSASGTTAVTLSGADATIAGDLTVTGNDIKSSTGATALTLDGANVTVPGDLTVSGGDLTIGNGAFIYSTNDPAIQLTGSDVTVIGDLSINGDLTVQGDTVQLNVSQLNVEDNSVILNSNVTGTPSLDASLTVERGTETNSSIKWNETTDKWEQDRAGTTTIIATNTDELNEGTTNQYFTNARARQAVSVSDTGGDGSLSYDNSTGVITYTGPSATEVRAHFTGGTGVSITDGVVAIGQSVATTEKVTFDQVTATNGSSIKNTLAVGGSTVDTNGYVNGFFATGLGPSPTSLFVDNTDTGQYGRIVLREYGNHNPGQTPSGTTTMGTSVISLEGIRGNATTKTATQANGQLGSLAFSSYDGTNFISQTSGAPVSAITALASENFAATTASFTASITGTTMTVSAVASGVLAPGMTITSGALAGTSITAMGNNTSGGAGTYTISPSQTVASTSMTGYQTTNAGNYMLINSQLQAVRHSTDARQPWLRTAMNAASGINSPYMSINIGAAPIVTSADRLLVNSAGTTYWRDYGRTAVTLNNSLLNISGVVSTDTAVVTGYIDNNSTPGTYSGVAGNKLTVTAVTSGVLSPGQLVTGTGVTQLTFITAQDSGTTGGAGVYSVSTNLATAGQAVASTTITTYPDNASLLGSNNLYITSSRKSGLIGRRRGIRNGDRIGGMFVNATYDDSGNTTTNGVASFRFQATETYSSTAQGSQLTVQTTKTGTNTLTDSFIHSLNSTTFKTDTLTLQDSSGVSLPGGKVNYRRTYGCFHKMANVTAGAADTVYAFDWTTDTNAHVNTQGVTVSNTSRLNIDAAGDYNVVIEMVAKNTDNADRIAYIWLAKNGTDLAETCIKLVLTKDTTTMLAKDWLVDGIAANDYLEVRFAVDNTSGISLEYTAAQTSPYARPAVASATITITPVGM